MFFVIFKNKRLNIYFKAGNTYFLCYNFYIFIDYIKDRGCYD